MFDHVLIVLLLCVFCILITLVIGEIRIRKFRRTHTHKSRKECKKLAQSLGDLINHLGGVLPQVESVTNLSWSLVDMKRANVKLSWLRSVTPTVVRQDLTITKSDGTILYSETLTPEVQEFDIQVDGNTAVNVSLIASTETFSSEPALLDFTLGDLEKPAPPSDLTHTVVSVEEVEEEVPPAEEAVQ